LRTPTGIIETLDPASGLQPPYVYAQGPDYDYRVEGGWLAYTKLAAKKLTLWTRSPAGVHRLASPFASIGRIAGLSASGETLVDVDDSRYLNLTSGGALIAPLHVSAAHGRAVFLAGDWYAITGRSLFRIATVTTPPDGPDGGGADGGSSNDAGTASDAGITGAVDGGASSPPGAVEPDPPASSAAAAAPPDATTDTSDAASCATATLGSGAVDAGGAFGALAVLAAALVLRRRDRRKR
jgi:hypothetical protein